MYEIEVEERRREKAELGNNGGQETEEKSETLVEVEVENSLNQEKRQTWIGLLTTSRLLS
jgi:hypothetical protein